MTRVVTTTDKLIHELTKEVKGLRRDLKQYFAQTQDKQKTQELKEPKRRKKG